MRCVSGQHLGVVGWLIAASCSSPGQVPRDERAPIAVAPAAAIDAGAPATIATDAAITAVVQAPDAGVDAQIFVNPFAGKACPAPKAIKRRKGKGDQSTALTDSILQPQLEITYQVGDPDLPVDDVFDASPSQEEEIFCGVIESIRRSAVHIASEGPNGPVRRILFVDVDLPLSRPFQVGSAVVVHAREVSLLGTGVRLSVMITDDRGELLLAQVEGAGEAYAPGFHVSDGPAPRYRGHGTPTRNSPPRLAPRREIHLTRAGKRAVSKETWRVLDTSDGRFAVWGVSEPLTPSRSSSALYVTRLRIVRLPQLPGSP